MPQVRATDIQETLKTGLKYLNNDHFVHTVAGVAIVAGATTGIISVPTVFASLSILSTAKTSVQIAKATGPAMIKTASAAVSSVSKSVIPLFKNYQDIYHDDNLEDLACQFDILGDDGTTIDVCTPAERHKVE